MTNFETIEEMLKDKLTEQNLELVACQWTTMGHMKVLQVQIAHDDGSMDLDTCAAISEVLSEKLDAADLFDFEYALEVCSPGAERELKTERELERAVGKHVYVKLKHPQGIIHEVTGDLVELSDVAVSIAYRVKQATKTINIEREEIASIRLAVKL